MVLMLLVSQKALLGERQVEADGVRGELIAVGGNRLIELLWSAGWQTGVSSEGTTLKRAGLGGRCR